MGSPPEWAEAVLKKTEGLRVFVNPGEVASSRFDLSPDETCDCDFCDSEARFYFQDLKLKVSLKTCTFHGSEIAGRLSE